MKRKTGHGTQNGANRNVLTRRILTGIRRGLAKGSIRGWRGSKKGQSDTLVSSFSRFISSPSSNQRRHQALLQSVHQLPNRQPQKRIPIPNANYFLALALSFSTAGGGKRGQSNTLVLQLCSIHFPQLRTKECSKASSNRSTHSPTDSSKNEPQPPTPIGFSF